MAGIPSHIVLTRFMAWKDRSEDVRTFQLAVKERRIKSPVSLSARTAFSGAVTVSYPGGNLKLSKSTEGGRQSRHKDDLAAAAIMAVSAGIQHCRPDSSASPLEDKVLR